MKRRIIPCILAILLVCQSGCGKSSAKFTNIEDKGEKFDDSGEIGASDSLIPAIISEEVMEAESGAVFMQLRGDASYYVRYERRDERTGEKGDSDSIPVFRMLCARQRDKSEEVIHAYEESFESNLYMLCSRVDTQGNWYNLFGKDDEEGNTEVYLEKLDADGNSLFFEMQEEYGELLDTERVIDGAVSADGSFCALTRHGTFVAWDAEGHVQGQLRLWNKEEEHEGKGLADAGAAGIYYYAATETEVTLKRIDPEEMSLGREDITLRISDSGHDAGAGINSNTGKSGGVYIQPIQVYSGYESGIFLTDENGLWNYGINEGELTFLFGWRDGNVNVKRDTIEQVSQKDDGILLLTYDITSDAVSQIWIAKVSESELLQKQRITLGCINDLSSYDNLEPLVRAYNAQSSVYTLELVPYGDGSELGTFSTGIDALTKELLKGEGPDLFVMNYMPRNTYISQGILEKLDPYLDGSGIRLVQPVREAVSVDGSLYTVAQSFYFLGFVSLEGYAENGGIRIGQVDKLAKAYPDSALLRHAGHLTMLEYMMNADMDRYLDIPDKSCHFDSEDFIELLNLVKSWKEHTYSRQELLSGASAEELYDHEYLMTHFMGNGILNFVQVHRAFDGFASIHGYPTLDGEAKFQVAFQTEFGMNSASGNKDGAWDFLAWLLSDEEQEKIGKWEYFPITEKYFEKAFEIGEGAEEKGYNMYTGRMETGLTVTEEDKEEIRFIVEHLYYPDAMLDDVHRIVYEETQGFFASQKTAEDVAATIQSRVGLLLSE